MNNETKQHVQLPNKMAEKGLTPKDQLVYLTIKSFMNKKTKSCFPSLVTISNKCKLSIPTIRKAIVKLKDSNYFTITKEGKKQIYHFTEMCNGFEPFSLTFIENDKISSTTKAYLVAVQQYLITDIEGLGKLSFSGRKTSEITNMPESTIRKCNNELERKNLSFNLINDNKDIETGCNTQTKVYNLDKLGQSVIWTLRNHEERITDIENNISQLKRENESQQKLIQKLIDKIDKLTATNTFIL